MDRRTLLLASALLLMVPMGLAQVEPGGAVEYQILIDCGPRVCPSHAIDGQDAMGDPAIAVDPDNPMDMIIASLHGVPDESGPSERSRSATVQQPFTTFTSTNGGSSWTDSPYTPPNGLAGYTGEHAALTIDPYGHVFVGSLYAGANGDGTYDYQIGAQKFSGIRDIEDNQNGAYHLEYIPPFRPDNAIHQMWFVYDRITDTMVMVWNEHPQDVLPGNGGLSADLLAAAEPLAAAPSDRQITDPFGGIGFVWTRADLDSPYEAPSLDDMIGPCDTSTNPVVSEGWVYVGCRVAEGQGALRWDESATAGNIALFRLRPNEGVPEYMGLAPLSGGEPKLGVRSDGRIALMTAEAIEGEMRLDGTFGQYVPESGHVEWGPVYDYASYLGAVPQGAELIEVNIQDLIYREYSGVNHIILKRVLQPDGVGLGAAEATERPVQKSIVALDEKHGVLAEIDLDIGDPVVRAQDPSLAAHPWQAYNDLADDFLELPSQPFEYDGKHLGLSYQREFFAVGDYGIIAFGELIEITNLRGPGIPAVPPPPPPPVPAPAPAATSVLAPAGVLAASSMTAAVTVKLKRKNAVGVKPRK